LVASGPQHALRWSPDGRHKYARVCLRLHQQAPAKMDPRASARLLPSPVRARISSRSNSAKPAQDSIAGAARSSRSGSLSKTGDNGEGLRMTPLCACRAPTTRGRSPGRPAVGQRTATCGYNYQGYSDATDLRK
jgi:hypothetical protein